jgi:hypothetical protein
MRVENSRAGADRSTEALAALIDDFTAIKAAGVAAPRIGGYRVLLPRHIGRPLVPTIARLAGARMRATGLLTVLFVGGLGLAVLAGPASCPCDLAPGASASAEASSGARGVARFAYLKQSAMVVASAPEPPGLSAAILVEPAEAHASPISTSAIEPPEKASVHEGYARRSGILPAKFEELTDAVPTKAIRLAALEEGEGAPMLPVVLVDTPPIPEIAAVDAEADAEKRLRQKHMSSRRRAIGTHPAKTRSAALSGPGSTSKRGKVPRWAQKMFETPWQSKAFSYE